MSRVGVGIIGAGFMGDEHARAYRLAAALRPELEIRPELVACADVDATRLAEFAAAWSPGRTTAEWQSVVADPAVDLVDVCLPPFLHRPVALAAIAAGKHVYCEKPVGLDAGETAEIAAAAGAAGVRTLTGFNYRRLPAIALARQLLESGRIGELRQVAVGFESGWAADPDEPWSWRFSAQRAGAGALGDVGSHVFDMARYLAGEFELTAATVETQIHERPGEEGATAVDNDDVFFALGRFANGAIGHLEGSRVATGATIDFGWALTGTRGALRWSLDDFNRLELYEAGAAPLDGFTSIVLGPAHPLQATFSVVRGLAPGYADSKVAEVQHLLDCLATDREPSPSFEDALAAARLVEAAQELSRG